MAHQRTYDTCQAIRARVQMRKDGALPTDQDAIDRAVSRLIGGRYHNDAYPGTNLTKADIKRAFVRGEEVIVYHVYAFTIGRLNCYSGFHGDTHGMHRIRPHICPRSYREVAALCAQTNEAQVNQTKARRETKPRCLIFTEAYGAVNQKSP